MPDKQEPRPDQQPKNVDDARPAQNEQPLPSTPVPVKVKKQEPAGESSKVKNVQGTSPAEGGTSGAEKPKRSISMPEISKPKEKSADQPQKKAEAQPIAGKATTIGARPTLYQIQKRASESELSNPAAPRKDVTPKEGTVMISLQEPPSVFKEQRKAKDVIRVVSRRTTVDPALQIIQAASQHSLRSTPSDTSITPSQQNKGSITISRARTGKNKITWRKAALPMEDTLEKQKVRNILAHTTALESERMLAQTQAQLLEFLETFDQSGADEPEGDDIDKEEKKARLLKKLTAKAKDLNKIKKLQMFKIPDQEKLLATAIRSDPIRSDFNNHICHYFSPVLRRYIPSNNTGCYRGPHARSNFFRSVNIRCLGPKSLFLERQKCKKLAVNNKYLNTLRHIATDDTHFNFLKELVANQRISVPLTIIHDIASEVLPMINNMQAFYNKRLGPDHECTEQAVDALLKMLNKVIMYNSI